MYKVRKIRGTCYRKPGFSYKKIRETDQCNCNKIWHVSLLLHNSECCTLLSERAKHPRRERFNNRYIRLILFLTSRKTYDSHNMAVKEKSENVAEGIEWNVDTEVQLFYAMHGHKPVGKIWLYSFSKQCVEVLWYIQSIWYSMKADFHLFSFSFAGVNKYFQMACILEKFRNSVNKDITSKVIWDHLDTMYDMQALVRISDKFINVLWIRISSFWVKILFSWKKPV